MEKPLYNQGDLLQYQRRTSKVAHLCVITDVFTTGRGKYADTYYKFMWFNDGSKQVFQINTLDDDLSFKLLARG